MACEKAQRQNEHGASMAQSSLSAERTQSAEGGNRLLAETRSVSWRTYPEGCCMAEDLGGHSRLYAGNQALPDVEIGKKQI